MHELVDKIVNGIAICWSYWPQIEIVFRSKNITWRHNERDGVSNYQPHGPVLKHFFRRRSKIRVTGLCEGNSPFTG